MPNKKSVFHTLGDHIKNLFIVIGVLAVGVFAFRYFSVGDQLLSLLPEDIAALFEESDTASHTDVGDENLPPGPDSETRLITVAATDSHGDEPHDDSGDDDHDGGEGHDDDAGDVIRLTPDEITELGITTAPAQTRLLSLETELLGEIALNVERTAHVFPTLPGVTESVQKTIGDTVVTGDVLAIIKSPELADAKSLFLANRERVSLALSRFEREETLWQQQITSEQEYIDARQALAEARIELRSAEQKLRAFGLGDGDIQQIQAGSTASLIRYPLVSPIDGTVLDREITLGERVDTDDRVFLIADLATVWVIASVYEKDFARVRLGQSAAVRLDFYPEEDFAGQVTWIADTLDEATRTLKVRIEVDNAERLLKPGMFVQVILSVGNRGEALTVPAAALLSQRGEDIVFVADGDGEFERREVRIGTRTSEAFEVLAGLTNGEQVVVDGGFILKSELDKEGFGGDDHH